MENFCENLTRRVVNFKLARCCFVAPLRMGILIIGYFNIFVSVILIIGTATDSFMPTIKHIQDTIMEEGSKSTCILVPVTELAFSVLLLCAIHRNDVVLLRFYMLYAIAATAISVLVYTLVIAIVDILYIFVIVASILYQAYIVVLVRSAIVDIKLRTKVENNGNINHQSTGIYPKAVPDVETPEQPIEPGVVTVDVKKTVFKKMGQKKIEEKTLAETTVEENTKDTAAEKSEDKKSDGKKSEDKKADEKISEGKKSDAKKLDDNNKDEKRKIDKKEAKTKVETVNEKKLETIAETPKVTVKDTPKS